MTLALRHDFVSFWSNCTESTCKAHILLCQLLSLNNTCTIYMKWLQRLLDNTPVDHPDHVLLQQACRTMHELAVKIGTATDSQHEEDMQETLRKLELLLIEEVGGTR